jgi:hypothetical protein
MVTFDLNPRIARDDSPAYDPEQDAAEKRDIRKRYRLLEKRTGGALQTALPP